MLTKVEIELLRSKGWNRYQYISLLGTSFEWKKDEEDDGIHEDTIKELINLKKRK